MDIESDWRKESFFNPSLLPENDIYSILRDIEEVRVPDSYDDFGKAFIMVSMIARDIGVKVEMECEEIVNLNFQGGIYNYETKTIEIGCCDSSESFLKTFCHELSHFIQFEKMKKELPRNFDQHLAIEIEACNMSQIVYNFFFKKHFGKKEKSHFEMQDVAVDGIKKIWGIYTSKDEPRR